MRIQSILSYKNSENFNKMNLPIILSFTALMVIISFTLYDVPIESSYIFINPSLCYQYEGCAQLSCFVNVSDILRQRPHGIFDTGYYTDNKTYEKYLFEYNQLCLGNSTLMSTFVLPTLQD